MQFSCFDFKTGSTLKVLAAGMVIHSLDCKTRVSLLAGCLPVPSQVAQGHSCLSVASQEVCFFFL